MKRRLWKSRCALGFLLLIVCVFSSGLFSAMYASSGTTFSYCDPSLPVIGHQGEPKSEFRIPSLDELARVDETNYSCPSGTIPIYSKPQVAASPLASQYKIPLVIHQTCKSHCVTQEVFNVMKQWQDLGIPYYLHDDKSMEALIHSDAVRKAFPQLPLVWTHCLRVAAAKTDVWRMLLLWTYGGIYADVDCRPVCFRPLTHIHPSDDMYTLTDNAGLPSFHFMASVPKHPIMYMVIAHALKHVVKIYDTGAFNPARFTGPLAMRNALRSFLDGHDDVNNTNHAHIQSSDLNFTFSGTAGYTLRREGPKADSEKIVQENAFRNKRAVFMALRMPHYQENMQTNDFKTNRSCLDALYEYSK